MNDEPLTDASATLGALLRRPYELMSEWLYAELASEGFHDVRPAYSAVLRNLPLAGTRISDLAARAGMTKQSMGYLVARMQKAGLVDVVDHAEDRRATNVLLTARGKKAVERGIALSRRYEAHLAAVVGEQSMTQLRSTLRAMHEALRERPFP